MTVRDLDGTLARLEELGAPVVSIGGEPVTIGQRHAHRDRDRIPTEISSSSRNRMQLPNSAPPDANVVGVRLRLSVDDVEDRGSPLPASTLGLQGRVAPIGVYGNNAAVLRALGLTEGQYRVALLNVPASGLMFDFFDFKGIERRTVQGRIQDFGSTRVQLRVRDLEAAIAAFERFGGEVISTGGRPVALPAGNSTLKSRSCATRITCSSC